MEQRPLRLGDILDDYCPRERRVTNHAVVAMIGEEVKQTRCTTCDAEHVYKGGREPRRRKKDTPAVLYREVLSGMSEGEEATPPVPEPAPQPEAAAFAEAVSDHGTRDDVGEAPVSEGAEDPEPADAPVVEEGPVHRRLIRATLPRPEGAPVKDTRPIPEFTMRHSGGRGSGHFRGALHRGQGNGNGNGQRPRGRRFGGGTSPGGQGRGGNFRGGGNPQRAGGGKKRSR